MKQFLTLTLALLLSAASTGWSQKIQKAKRTYSTGVVEKVQARRNMSQWANRSDFFTALNAGCISYTTTATGTVYGISAACGGTNAAPPSWVTGTRYTHNGTTLTVEGAGQIATLSFALQSGQAFNATNPTGVAITSGTFYSPGQLSYQGVYDKEWKVNIAPQPMVITVKQAGTGATYSTNVITIAGANRVTLAGANSSPPVSTTPASVSAGPAWLSANYTQGSYLTVRGTPVGSPNGITMRIERVDGQAMTLSNPENPNLSSGVDYPYGIVNNLLDWTFGVVPNVPVRLTFKKPGESNYVYQFTPSNTVTPVSIFTATGGGGGTVTGPNSVSAGPSFLEARYTYSGNTIQVQGRPLVNNGTGLTMQINRVDGQAMSLSNASNPVLNSGTDYGYGTLTGQGAYTTDWTFNGVPPVPLRLVFKQTGQPQYQYVFTPVAGTTTPAQMFTYVSGGGETPPVCTTCGSSIASPLTNGFAEGNLAGLMLLAPFEPSNNQFASWSADEQTITRGSVTIGIDKQVGASITRLSRTSVRGGENLINTYQPGPGIKDTGRSMGWSTYGTPGGGPDGFDPFTQNGKSTSGQGDDTGWNPVQGGSRMLHRSPILFYERRNVAGYGEVLYAKVHPYHWSMNAELSNTFVHQWVWIDANEVPRYFYIYENNRTDTQRRYTGRTQEWPFVYVTAPLYRQMVYTGTSPGTNGGVQEIFQPQPVEGGGADNQNDTGRKLATEYWIGAVQPDNTGVFLFTPYNTAFRGKQFQSWGGTETSNASGYINSDVFANGDENLTVAYSGAMYVGSLSNFRTWYNDQPVPNLTSFNYDFTGGKTAGWYAQSGSARLVGGNYQWGVGSPQRDGERGHTRFVSPNFVKQASAISTVYVRGAFTGVTNLAIRWEKPNQTPVQGSVNLQPFTVIGDGQVRTYAITLSGNPQWNGMISSIAIGQPEERPTFYNGSEIFNPVSIGTTNPGN